MTRFALPLAALAALAGGRLATAADPPKVDRAIGREPAYRSKAPRYGLLAFGPEGKDRVWLVQDGDTLYVDRNGNGDLTDADEAVPAKKPREGVVPDEGEYAFEVGDVSAGGQKHKAVRVFARPLSRLANGPSGDRADVKAALAKDPKATVVMVSADAAVLGLKGGGIGGRVSFLAGFLDLNGALQLAAKPADAPVVRFGGPLEVTFYGDRPTLRAGRSVEFVLAVGTPGEGPGTFAMVGWSDTIPDGAYPVAEVVPPTAPGGGPAKERVELKQRCCGVNLYGPVRVPDAAGSASVTISFDAWKGAKVAPTTHALTIRPGKAAAKAEPVAPELVATLVHPDRKTSIWAVAFSPDGAKLFATGYPSGVVQIFDVAGRKELRRVETPPGLRGSADYALLTPDWKTLYVPVETRKVVSAERDGKPVRRVEQGGSVRVWDLATGEEQPPLRPAAGHSPEHAKLSPDGKSLVCVERPGFDATDDGPRPKDVTVIWDLATGQRRKLDDGFLLPTFAPDGKTLLIDGTDHDAKTSAVRVLDAATLKELARLDRPKGERFFSLDGVSPDGAVVALSLGGKRGAPREVWFRDAKTLADRGKFVGDGNQHPAGWGGSAFAPDGKLCVILGVPGKVALWDVAAGEVAREFDLGGRSDFNLAFSPDGKFLAVPWMPKYEGDGRDPDPQDYPQPRVTVFDASGKAPPRTLVSPHGFIGGVAFSPDGKTLAFGSSGGVHLFDLSK